MYKIIACAHDARVDFWGIKADNPTTLNVFANPASKDSGIILKGAAS
jgi:hypothetical protein